MTNRVRRRTVVRYCCASLPLEVIKATAAQQDYRCWCARRDGVELLPVPRREAS